VTEGAHRVSKHQALLMRMTRKTTEHWLMWSHEGSPGGEEMAAVGDAQTQLHHHEGEGTNDLCRLVTRATVYGTANKR
jgi:hypothetical protein